MAGQRIIVLNSKEVVEDLLVHRATKYSDRYKLLVGGYVTGNLTLPFIEYNERQVVWSFLAQLALIVRSAGVKCGVQVKLPWV